MTDKSIPNSFDLAGSSSDETIRSSFQSTQRLNACIEVYVNRDLRRALLSNGLRHVNGGTRVKHGTRATHAAQPSSRRPAWSLQTREDLPRPGSARSVFLGCSRWQRRLSERLRQY